MNNRCPNSREILEAIFARMNALPLDLRQMVDNGTLELHEAELILAEARALACPATVH